MNPVVSAEWLVNQLDNPQIAIADCRFQLANPQLGRNQYQESHILGAYYLDLNLDLSAPVGENGGRHPLPDAASFAAKMAAMGVEWGKTWVIAYDDSAMAFAARLWWLLRYFGHEQVAILDGGWSGWVNQSYPVTTDGPAAKTGEFIPQVQPHWVVDYQELLKRKDQPTVTLIDSREGDRYRGEREPIDPQAGHIPGAMNFPWRDVCTTDGYLRPLAEQEQRWQTIGTEQEIIVYCGSGVTACVNLLSLELAGIPNAKLYVGGWSDWCSYHLLP
ncbi:sulfurtransferase [Spirulina subsalsa]|uniref:sulfurtransferase n=1 Tax=Spirulina subsalsa TaxID=54311 RepID=UPI0002EEBA10|nr:sulfurtransferase [Spirulina subsalsa]